MKRSLGVILLLSSLIFTTGCANQEVTPDTTTPPVITQEVETTQTSQSGSETEAPVEQESSIVTVFQPDGSEVIIEGTPESVVVMAATTLEILYTLGVEQVVGNSSLQARPDLMHLFPDSVDVGLTQSPDMEILATLNPDLIIAPSTFMGTMQELFEAQGYVIWFANNQTYSNTIRLLQDLGDVFEVQERANEVISEIESGREAVVERVRGHVEDITAMIIFGAGDNIMFGTNESYVGYILEAFGAGNVTDGMEFDMINAGFVPFSLEQAIVMNPDIIFRIAHGNIEQTALMFDEMFDSNPAFHAMAAYINGRVYDLEHTLFFSNPGVRTIQAFEYIASVLLS